MPVYSEKVMAHFMNPRNVGEIESPDGVGEVGNPVCGDMMTFNIKVKDNHLEDVKFKTFGCGAAIAVSSGSACTSRALKASHVLIAMGISHELAQGSLLFSFGLDNTPEDIDYVLEVLPDIVDRLRQMSPLYAKFMKESKGGK